PGATVIPLIVSSDKTQLTLFHGKTAYPIYMTIGNIPKDIWQKTYGKRHMAKDRWRKTYAQLLIGYIPTTKLEGVTNKATRRCVLANLFHTCMHTVLGPISSYGETGVAMMSSD
ncbi:hypothetical protein DFH94DRAFT_613700, partial [Russula ochroleuca]